MTTEKTGQPVFVAGATGYIGGRLVPRLLDAGYRVRALVRAPEKLQSRPWGEHERIEIIKGDVLDSETLKRALTGCQSAYYLVHSMNPTVGDFARTDRQAAVNMAQAAAAAELEQIIYLGGLGETSGQLSHHLASRTEVGELLRQGPVPVTILRAAMIIGSGSASFEILRYLVEHLPVMITPRWVDTPCQPIGIRNVLHYLVGCLQVPALRGGTFDIGQPEITSYRELMKIYAEEAGLAKRWIIPVPVLTPRLSSYWIHLVTPVPAAHCPTTGGRVEQPRCLQRRSHYKTASSRAVRRPAKPSAWPWIGSGNNRWKPLGPIQDASPPAEWSIPGDPGWAGGNLFEDSRKVILAGSAEEIWPAVSSIGGEVGYYYANWLWRLRGAIDRLCGGVGLRRGRRSSKELYPGDAIDFWRVVAVARPGFLMLSAEMKVPGKAVLLFKLRPLSDTSTELQQIARFLPRGLLGPALLVCGAAVSSFCL